MKRWLFVTAALAACGPATSTTNDPPAGVTRPRPDGSPTTTQPPKTRRTGLLDTGAVALEKVRP